MVEITTQEKELLEKYVFLKKKLVQKKKKLEQDLALTEQVILEREIEELESITAKIRDHATALFAKKLKDLDKKLK